MGMWTIVFIIVGTAAYVIIGFAQFMNEIFEDSMGAAFGWGAGPSMGISFVRAVVWPVFLVIDLIFTGIQMLRERA